MGAGCSGLRDVIHPVADRGYGLHTVTSVLKSAQLLRLSNTSTRKRNASSTSASAIFLANFTASVATIDKSEKALSYQSGVGFGGRVVEDDVNAELSLAIFILVNRRTFAELDAPFVRRGPSFSYRPARALAIPDGATGLVVSAPFMSDADGIRPACKFSTLPERRIGLTLAKQLSLIRSPDALNLREICGLVPLSMYSKMPRGNRRLASRRSSA